MCEYCHRHDYFDNINVVNKTLRFFVALILVSIISLLATKPIIEGDIFWHIKTGEWIWKHKSLMSEDPFTYTSQKEDPTRPYSVRYEVILKGYWLSQLIFYSIWSMLGATGIVIVRICILSLILLVLYLWMRKKGVDFFLSILFMCLIGYYMMDMTDRPQNFSFLFFPITVLLLEHLRASGCHIRAGAENRHYLAGYPSGAFVLPLIMATWSNMHGGYITGVTVIGIYAVAEGMNALYKKVRRLPNSLNYGRFLLVCSVSAVATLLNPTTYKSFLLVFQFMREGPKTVSELMSPFETMRLYGELRPTYWILIFITAAVCALRIIIAPLSKAIIAIFTRDSLWNALDFFVESVLTSRFWVLLFFATASLMVQRNTTFFFCVIPLAAIEISGLLKQRFRIIIAAISIASFLTIPWLFVQQIRSDRILKFEIAPGMYPEGAVRFMKTVRPTGNIFNLAEWGSYMILTMPEYKVFDDGRRLMDNVELAHISVLYPNPHSFVSGFSGWKAVLNAYHVNVIIIPSVSPFLGDFFTITKALYTDDDFSLVYQDRISLIYLRKGSGNDSIIWKYSAPKELSLIQAINTLSYSARSSTQLENNQKIISELRAMMKGSDFLK